MAGGDATFTQVGTNTAIAYAVAVGLPGGSAAAAGERLWLSLLGGLWALLGAWLQQSLVSKRKSGEASDTPETLSTQLKGFLELLWLSGRSLHPDVFRNAIAIGVASAFGLTLGLVFGLPRDYWAIITIIIAVRPSIGSTVIALPPKMGSTVAFTSRRVIGTVAGAVIAWAITLEVSNLYLLGGLLFAFSVGMFATRGVNPVLVQVFLVPFVIILFNLLYPGQSQLAELRIVDVIIGGAVAIATVFLLGFKTKTHGFF
jgi:uncharacterized membrane protein YccC